MGEIKLRTFRVDVDVWDELAALAKERGMTVSGYLRLFMEQQVKRLKAERRG